MTRLVVAGHHNMAFNRPMAGSNGLLLHDMSMYHLSMPEGIEREAKADAQQLTPVEHRA